MISIISNEIKEEIDDINLEISEENPKSDTNSSAKNCSKVFHSTKSQLQLDGARRRQRKRADAEACRNDMGLFIEKQNKNKTF